MIHRPFGRSGLVLPNLGLGCARIASLTTVPSAHEIAGLLDDAVAGGIRFFDTADIYGQGDSERRLARIGAQTGIAICTKAGLDLSASQRLVRLAKPLLRPMLVTVAAARAGARRMRRASEISDPDPDSLRPRLMASLARLRRDRVEVFLVHSPEAAALADERMITRLHEIRAAGLAVAVGVSCRTVEDARALVDSVALDALELPLSVETLEAAGPVLDAAARAGVGVIAREVLDGGVLARRGLAAALTPLMQDPRIGVVLTGTTSRAHLAENLAVAQALAGSCDA